MCLSQSELDPFDIICAGHWRDDIYMLTYLTGIRRITGIWALPGCMDLIVKKSNYNANRLKLKLEF